MRILFSDTKHNILSVKEDKRAELMNWGLDNSFPSLIENLFSMSVTGSAALDKASKALFAGGVTAQFAELQLNSEFHTLNDLLAEASKQLIQQGNVFIHIGYNELLEVASLKVIPATNIRVGKTDSKKYSGKFLVYDNFDKSKGKISLDKFIKIDKYNPLKEVIQAQIDKAGNISNYNGQILHLKNELNSVYGMPKVNSILSELLLESNSQIFRSKGAESGFLNTKLLVTKPFNTDYERQAFKHQLNSLKGANSTGQVLVLESSTATEDLNQQLKMEDLSSKFDDKLFEYSDSQARNNICIALGVPKMLIDNSDSGLFGNSGELLKQARIELHNSLNVERGLLLRVFKMLLSNYKDEINIQELTIIDNLNLQNDAA